MSPDRSPTPAYAGLEIHVEVEEPGWASVLPGDAEAEVRRAVEAAARRAGLDPAVETELGVRLSGDAAVRELNAAWRGKDKPTNILSFPVEAIAPGETPGPLMGDLVLALETLSAEAAAEGKRPIDHLRHLLVHGTLHLLGHDHEDEGSAEAMERLEILALSDLSVADPYAEPPLRQPAEASST